MDKLKLLLVGACANENGCTALTAKLKALQASKAGPFDAVLIAGPVHPKLLSDHGNTEDTGRPSLPIYIQDDSLFSESALTSAIAASKQLKEDAENEAKEADDDGQAEAANKLADNLKLVKLKENMFLLRNWDDPDNGGVWSLQIKDRKPPLVIAACPPRVQADKSSLINQLSHVSYTGCDILLSSQGPQGLEQYGIEGSYDVAAVALPARARYHVVASHSVKFVQSPPFAHLKATTNTASIKHAGRVLALGPVVPGKVDKSCKYIHALGLVPLHYGKPEALPSNLLLNPYTDASYERDGNSNMKSTIGLSQASARRILQEESGCTNDHRWAQKRQRDEGPPDPDTTTLFLHGLHRDVTGELQGSRGDDTILQALSKWGATQIRRPQTANFCFADFDSHGEALACHSSLHGRLNVKGVDLDVKWASSRKEGDSNKKVRLSEKDAQDSSTVRYKITKSESASNSKIGEELRVWMEETLEKALAGDGDEVVKAADEPALQVAIRIPEGADSFGFLEFASHAAASMALATLTGSTDGGRALEDNLPPTCRESNGGIYLNWAKAASNDNVILDDSGFTFTRQHFPADSRSDCWFCLASEGCERHLITGVYQHCYAAMPKGAVHDAHVLLIPVQHSSKGVWQGKSDAAEEMDLIKKKLREYVKETYNSELFVFERAIQTKGGYHTHVQCIPVPLGTGIKLQTTMLAQARRAGMVMTELNSDLGLKSLLDDDSEEGYFYAETPVSSVDFKRYVYKHTGDAMVPLQFGREVLAAALHKPELAHWKSCVVDREKETELSSKLRDGFKFDFNK